MMRIHIARKQQISHRGVDRKHCLQGTIQQGNWRVTPQGRWIEGAVCEGLAEGFPFLATVGVAAGALDDLIFVVEGLYVAISEMVGSEKGVDVLGRVGISQIGDRGVGVCVCVCFCFILTPLPGLTWKQGSFRLEPWSVLRGKNLV